MHTAPCLTKNRTLGALPYGTTTLLTNMLQNGIMPSIAQPRPHVLCISRDRVLGETRRKILESRYTAVSVENLEDLTVLAAGEAFDAIVLCHTLSPDDCQRCLEMVHRLWPGAKVVSMTAGATQGRPMGDRVVSGLSGPLALLNAVQQVLQPALPAVGPS